MNIPDFIKQHGGDAHPAIADWHRVGPWLRGAADQVNARYERSTYGAQHAVVRLPSYLFTDAAAAAWEIEHQLKRANDMQRRRSHPKRRRA